MKIIDKTPFVSETGEISLVDRAKATMKFGTSWFPEVEAQRQILPIFNQVLDKSYTLLRNITPPGLGATIPFILVGPTGVYVMYVSAQRGTFRAKGEDWGTIANNAFRPSTPNLLAVTTRMARAVQLYLKRQGYESVTVESALLCADPGMHVDSQRPAVRVVMRDALERFGVSIAQSRAALSPELVYAIAERLVNPKPAQTAQPAAGAPAGTAASAEDLAAEAEHVPAFALPESEAGSQSASDWLSRLDGPPAQSAPPSAAAQPPQGQPRPAAPAPARARPPVQSRPAPPRKPGMKPMQWIILGVLALILFCALAGFAYILYMNL
jgi:hypothetical protein